MPHIVVFVNVTVEFFHLFHSREWVQKVYSLSDNEKADNVSQWHLLFAGSVSIPKFEISRLYSSVITGPTAAAFGAAGIARSEDIKTVLRYVHFFTIAHACLSARVCVCE